MKLKLHTFAIFLRAVYVCVLQNIPLRRNDFYDVYDTILQKYKNRSYKKTILAMAILFTAILPLNAQYQNLVTYAGNGEQEFQDVMELSNGDILVVGSSKDLSWVSGTTPQLLTYPTINNTSTSGNMAVMIVFDANATTIKKVRYLPANAAENFRFIKTNSATTTADLYVSGTTSTGYFIGKLNNNFVSGDPTGFSWIFNVTATDGDYPKTNQPWDVMSNGNVIFARGESHGTGWSEIGKLNPNGTRGVMTKWLTHWPLAGSEFYGLAQDYPGSSSFPSGAAGLSYSAIVFKKDKRCDLRSRTQADYDLWTPDGNGGTKKGKWPNDVFYNSPCTPGIDPPNNAGPGYTGYYNPSGTFGPSSIAINKNTNSIYIGFNNKSVLNSIPDFEPSVMAMTPDGELMWWSRLYHEKRADGTLQNSLPDQYVDALAIDYKNNQLLVVARSHGNNTENLWEGNTVANNPSAYGFQNRFTGTSGNIHISWIGKLGLSDGTFFKSTYFAEYAEGASGLGTAHPDPNLDGFPNPNNGWAELNTTRSVPNTAKVTSKGQVVVLARARRTITTTNAFQKMPLPSTGLFSCWNNFVRVYKEDLTAPVYSSLLVGDWNKTTQVGGDNVNLRGVVKTAKGLLVVGYHTGAGAEMPTANIPTWGKSTMNTGVNTAVLAYFKTALLDETNSTLATSDPMNYSEIKVYPNPSSSGEFFVMLPKEMQGENLKYRVYTLDARLVKEGVLSAIPNVWVKETGTYLLQIIQDNQIITTKKIIKN